MNRAWTIALGLIALPLAIVVVLAALFLWSPPLALNALNDLVPGDTGVRRVARAVPFANGNALDVWAPAAAAPPSKRRPVLVFFYGGAWVKGQRREYAFVAKAFAARGFVVVMPDYRKVPGVRFPAFVQDGAAAVRWTRDNAARYGGDPGRVVLAGHSAGAYIAVMLALDRRYLRAAGVDPAIVRAAVGLCGPYDFYPFDSPRAVAAMGRWPRPAETQPISFARADTPPLLLMAGGADTVVRPRNAVRLDARLHLLGNRTARLRLYPGRGHDAFIMAIAKPFRRTLPILPEMLSFFAAHDGPPTK